MVASNDTQLKATSPATRLHLGRWGLRRYWRRPPRRLAHELDHRLRQLVPSDPRYRAERNHLRLLEPQRARERDDPLLELPGAQLVDLREHHDGRRADLGEELEHQEIVWRWRMARVDELHHPAQRRADAQIPLDERPPHLAGRLRDAGEAVPRKVGEHELIVDAKEIDLARL